MAAVLHPDKLAALRKGLVRSKAPKRSLTKPLSTDQGGVTLDSDNLVHNLARRMATAPGSAGTYGAGVGPGNPAASRELSPEQDYRRALRQGMGIQDVRNATAAQIAALAGAGLLGPGRPKTPKPKTAAGRPQPKVGSNAQAGGRASRAPSSRRY